MHKYSLNNALVEKSTHDVFHSSQSVPLREQNTCLALRLQTEPHDVGSFDSLAQRAGDLVMKRSLAHAT